MLDVGVVTSRCRLECGGDRGLAGVAGVGVGGSGRDAGLRGEAVDGALNGKRLLVGGVGKGRMGVEVTLEDGKVPPTLGEKCSALSGEHATAPASLVLHSGGLGSGLFAGEMSRTSMSRRKRG